MSSRSRIAQQGLREMGQKTGMTSGTQTPATPSTVGAGLYRQPSVDAPTPRGILKDSSQSKVPPSAITAAPPPIPPMTGPSGNVPAEWVYPLHVPLETLYTGAKLRYRVTRYLLSGTTQESYVGKYLVPL